LVERGVNVLARDPPLQLCVDLERRLGVGVADLVHDVRQWSARLEHQADVRAAKRMRRDSRQRRDPALGADLVGAIDDWSENPLTHAVFVARATAGGGEHELVDAGWLALGAPCVQLHAVRRILVLCVGSRV
jgi:hypothetical protein